MGMSDIGMSDKNLLAVALSGGIDSSVAAFLLKKDWERLVGASHFIWPDSRCCSVEVFDRAREVCKRLNIPYLQSDLFPEFKEKVVGDFINTYLRGKTPNPCVACNRFIRFDLFYRRLESRLKEEGYLPEGGDLYFSTGHYARIEKRPEGYFLARAKDQAKDQTYMLYRIDKNLLKKLVFPLGNYLKSEVVALAEEIGLEYSSVKESQDACFVETGYVDFIAGQTGRDDFIKPGEIVDLKGRVLGKHRGAVYYTVGQRRGLGLGSGPWYVAKIDPGANRVYVGRKVEAQKTSLLVEDLSWFIPFPRAALNCGVKIRYQTKELPCRIEPEDNLVRVILKKPEIVTPGQSAVFYGDNLVLGGGKIV